MIRAREEGCGSGVDLVVDGICEGKGVRDPTNACAFINAFFAVSIVCSRPNKNKKVYSSPLKTPSLEPFVCVVGMEERVEVEVEILIEARQSRLL
jgi:hypothetical protein